VLHFFLGYLPVLLATGGAGFIGANFILDWLAVSPEPVINLDKLTYAGNPHTLRAVAGDSRCRFVHGDIGDSDLLARLLTEYRPRAVVKFAAESHVDRSIHGPGEFIQTNVMGSFRLLDAVRGYWAALPAAEREAFRFLHVATDEVYGSLSPDAPAFAETNPYEPNSPYSASKAASDHLVRAWHHTYGLPVLQGGRVGETCNIGGWNEMPNIVIVKTICALLDEMRPDPAGPYERLLTYVKDRPGHDRRYAIDARKIERELGWRPQETFETGLSKTVAWYLQNQGWVENVTSGGYRDWVTANYAGRA
jgi:dTDP-glucose 4,6-dehydratase